MRHLLWSALILTLFGGLASALDSTETAKIRYLIASVEALQGVTFIRNGLEYDAKNAADHLRLKLGAAGDRVKTAEDFIRLCGSQSSLSGKPYRMRFPDGTTMDTEAFLRRKLKSFAAGPSPGP